MSKMSANTKKAKPEDLEQLRIQCSRRLENMCLDSEMATAVNALISVVIHQAEQIKDLKRSVADLEDLL
jgi:polyhydroxyalkanoate synthesis regulator phasin